MTFCEAWAVQPKSWFPEHPEQGPLPPDWPSLHPLWQTPAPLCSCSTSLLPLLTQAQPPQGLVPALGSTTIYLAQSRIRRDIAQRQGKQAPVRTRGEDLLGVLLSFPACVSFREKGFWLSLAAPQHKCFAH